MNCYEARDLLLEADLDDPRFAWNTDLSEHLRACSGCRSVADAFVGVESLLRDEVTRAIERGVSPSTTRSIVPGSAGPVVQGRRGARAVTVLAAAAAAVATLLLIDRRTSEGDPPAPLLTMDAVSVVEVPEGRSAMIFRTPDPNITVVWIYRDSER